MRGNRPSWRRFSIVGTRPSAGPQLAQGERKQGQQAGPAREALGDRVEHLELAGAGEQESTGPRVGIHHALKVGEEQGTSLDLVQDGLGAELAQESTGILVRKAAGVGILKGKVRGIGHRGSGEGGLPGLAWTRDHDDRIRGEAPQEERLKEARNRMRWRGRWHFDQLNTSIYTWASISPG